MLEHESLYRLNLLFIRNIVSKRKNLGQGLVPRPKLTSFFVSGLCLYPGSRLSISVIGLRHSRLPDGLGILIRQAGQTSDPVGSALCGLR